MWFEFESRQQPRDKAGSSEGYSSQMNLLDESAAPNRQLPWAALTQGTDWLLTDPLLTATYCL